MKKQYSFIAINEKTKHKEVHEFIYEKAKIKAKAEIFKISEIDNFINFLNSYSSNSTIILATSKDIGKPGPLIDKLILRLSINEMYYFDDVPPMDMSTMTILRIQ